MSAGYVYLLRERDFLSGQVGQYLKIGLTEREVGKRIKEHQTGNAREVFSIYEKRVAFMSKMETYLHHYYSSERVYGEWFDLNDERVQSETIPLIERLNDEQTVLETNNSFSESYKNSPDNGLIRDPNEDEKQLFVEYKAVNEALTLAKARNKIHDLKLRNLICNSGGIHSIVTLKKKSQSDYFNKASFIKSLSPTEFALCHHDELEFNSKIKFASVTNIKALEPDLQNLLKAEEGLLKTNPVVIGDLSKPLSSRTVEAENIHAEYLSSRKLLKSLQWDMELLTSQLLSKLGNDREIKGIVSWVREHVEVKDKWCLKSAREHLSEKVANYTKKRPDIVAVEIADGRCYKLAKT